MQFLAFLARRWSNTLSTMSEPRGKVATAVTQIRTDGALVVDFDPQQVPFEDQEAIIEEGLRARGWTVEFLQSDRTTKRRLFKIEKGGVSIEIITISSPIWLGVAEEDRTTRSESSFLVQMTSMLLISSLARLVVLEAP